MTADPPGPRAEAGSDRRRELLATDASMRRVRWIGALFALAQFNLYEAPPGIEPAFSAPVMSVLIAGLLLSVNVISRASSSIEDTKLLARIGLGQHLADTAIVLGIIWLFSFDFTSALWGLLVIPVIEGAIRAQLRGALLTWAGISVFYITRDVYAASEFSGLVRTLDAGFRLDSVTYRLGVVLVVAFAIGYLASNLRERMSELARLTDESERRADLLHIVASTSRSTSLQLASSLATVTRAVVELGFEGAEICEFDRETNTYRSIHSHGLPTAYASRDHSAETGIAGIARRRRETVVVDDYSASPHAVRELIPLGYRAVAACPIRPTTDVEAVLVAGTRHRSHITDFEIEALDLLAAQAGVAVSASRRHAERAGYEARLRDMAYHDQLTGLANRASFLDTLRECLVDRGTTGLAIAMVDLDQFKRVNDSLGHEAGDELIRQVATIIRAAVRSQDTVARFGGDEFTVLLDEPCDADFAERSARTIIEALRDPISLEGVAVHVSASVGVAFSTGGHTERELLREADLAMYRAKDLGGNDACLYRDGMRSLGPGHLELETEIRRALVAEEFEMYFQPLFRTPDMAVRGVEGLIRWDHPLRGIIKPERFISVAEESGLIIPMGRWVLDRVLAQAAAWRVDHPDLRAAVNVCASEFRQPTFVDDLAAAAARHGVPPSSVVLEVTESVVMQDDDAMIDIMRSISRLGFLIAIDDFGSGYSSLRHLRSFPIDIIKIDRSFVQGLPKSDSDRAIVRAVLALARDLDIEVVAEGVETEAQLTYLTRVGCDLLQGDLLFAAASSTCTQAVLDDPTIAKHDTGVPLGMLGA